MRIAILASVILCLWGCSTLPENVVDADTVSISKSKGKTYVNNELFSGKLIKRYPNGDTASVEQFKQGNQDGLSYYWYSNGQLKAERRFKDNRKHGTHVGWYESGTQGFVYHFSDGVYTDTLKEWYDNGQLYLKSYYVNGQQEGRQQAWKRDGELYMNYDVKNGRKYGNAGIKHCKSLWSDVVAGM